MCATNWSGCVRRCTKRSVRRDWLCYICALIEPFSIVTPDCANHKRYVVVYIHECQNPTATEPAFSIRLRSHATSDASGPQVDFGSVRGQIQSGVVLETQVPPMLIFCLAEEVDYNCGATNKNYFTDMGTLAHRIHC